MPPWGSGERSRALSLAWSAVAKGAGLPGFEFLAFHELVRLGGVTPAAVDRLAAPASVHEGVRVRLLYEQAVDNHLVAIYERTGIQDRAGLIRLHEILT